MTLHDIVAALGGDIYNGGGRASIPAPGHSAEDRSISLWLTEGRVVIHGFGAVDWRVARDDLRERGFIDHAGRLTRGGRGRASTPRPDRRLRTKTALRLWDAAVALVSQDPAGLHLRRRAVAGGVTAASLGFSPATPVSVYRRGGPFRPAMLARISDADDRLTAVEVTYLEPGGRIALGLRLARKTVGQVPPGGAVRLSPSAEAMLVAEGVITTLSAMDRFRLPGWALMAANNLAVWTPPAGVRHVLIAADRGPAGEGAAARLRHRLLGAGLAVDVVLPDPPFGDWNDVAIGAAPQEEEGGR